MKKSEEELKAEFLIEAEAAFDELMTWDKNTKEPDLSQIEEIVLKMRKKLGEDLAQAALERQEQRQPAEQVMCPKCGGKQKNKGLKANRIESMAGSIELERGYYYCEKCKAGYFPPG